MLEPADRSAEGVSNRSWIDFIKVLPKDFQWLSKNAAKHRGRWIAIHEGKLVADATSLDELLERVSTLVLTHTPLIHFIE